MPGFEEAELPDDPDEVIDRSAQTGPGRAV